jgi:hypothetical protein
MDSPSSSRGSPAHVAGSPRTLDVSVVTRPPQSSRAARCVHALVASAPVAGFSTSGRLAAARKVNETESGLRTLGSRLRSPQPSLAKGPAAIARPDRSVSPSGVTPSAPDRSYMWNEQFTWPTPHSRQDTSGLPGAPENAEDAESLTQCDARLAKRAVSMTRACGPRASRDLADHS